MKQFLLNSLLIIGSAFIYIQCVKFLSESNSIRHRVPVSQKIDEMRDNKPKIVPINSTSVFKFNFKDRLWVPFFSGQNFPLNMAAYMDYHTLLNHDEHSGYDLVDNLKNKSYLDNSR